MLTATTSRPLAGGPSSPAADFGLAIERAGERYRARLREVCAGLAAGRGPGRPARAAGIVLGGALAGSGFRDQQWLVERDGRFVQLTELLYRIVEQADGARSLDEVAAAVARQTGRPVSAGNVALLIERTLAPAGLVTLAGGGALPAARPRRDPLAVRMRLRLLGPRAIDPLARIVQWLFWPPLLLAALVAVGLGHAWLYLVHGLDPGSVAGVLTVPGQAMLLLGLIVAGGVVHELGHAAALRYGGGRVRGIGAGWYLVYPVFYTDVTDAYRLGRWGRVRTDLGGFYFHLLFTLGLIAAYWWTGSEALLLAAVAINLEVIRQSLPFLRLDGYWTLTDLAGVPDFLSMVGPWLRSALPLPWWRGQRLPPLRRWVAGVFAGYLAITIPLLALMLYHLLRAMPATAEATGRAAGQQAAALLAAVEAGQPVTAAASAAHLLFLGLLCAGLGLMLAGITRIAGRLLWALARRVVMSPIAAVRH